MVIKYQKMIEVMNYSNSKKQQQLEKHNKENLNLQNKGWLSISMNR